MSDHFDFAVNPGDLVTEAAETTVRTISIEMTNVIISSVSVGGGEAGDIGELALTAATAGSSEDGGVIAPSLDDFIDSIPQLPAPTTAETDAIL